MQHATSSSPVSSGEQRLVRAVAACVFLYSAYRAATLSLTHDEAVTYLSHARGTLQEILTFANWIPSNNHLLNTLLIKAAVGVFGDSELAIRLPALLGLVLYLFGCARILAFVTHGRRLVLGFLLLTSNPYVLDFFSIARGYGLALGFLALGMHGFFQRIAHPDPGQRRRYGWLACGAFLLASLANLGFGIPFLAVLGVIALLDLRALLEERSFRPLSVLVPLAFLGLFRLAYDSHNLARIRQQVRNFGGENGFWSDSVGSVVHGSLYDPHWPPLGLSLPASIFLALVLTYSLLHLARARRIGFARHGERLLPGLLALFVVIAIGIQLQRALFELHYPIGRGVLYLIPLFHLLLILCWDLGARQPGLRGTRTISFLCQLAVVALILQGAWNLNLTHTLRWRYDADTREAMLALREMFPRPDAVAGSPSPPPKIRLGVNSVFEPSTNYYRERLGMHWFEATERKQDLRDPFDVYFLRSAHWVELVGIDLVRDFEISGACIAQRGNGAETVPPGGPENSENEF